MLQHALTGEKMGIIKIALLSCLFTIIYLSAVGASVSLIRIIFNKLFNINDGDLKLSMILSAIWPIGLIVVLVACHLKIMSDYTLNYVLNYLDKTDKHTDINKLFKDRIDNFKINQCNENSFNKTKSLKANKANKANKEYFYY